MSVTQDATPNIPSKADLYRRAREHLATADAAAAPSLREVAEALALLVSHHKVSQREMADELGMSQSKVSRLLKWHATGFKDATPFGPTTKAGRDAHANKRVMKPSRTEPNLTVVPKIETGMTAAEASAAARRTEYKAAEEAEAALASEDGEAAAEVDIDCAPRQPETQPKPEGKGKRLPSDKALAEFKYAVGQYLPAMTPEDRRNALDCVAGQIERLKRLEQEMAA